jgi:hypothetical protein
MLAGQAAFEMRDKTRQRTSGPLMIGQSILLSPDTGLIASRPEAQVPRLMETVWPNKIQ